MSVGVPEELCRQVVRHPNRDEWPHTQRQLRRWVVRGAVRVESAAGVVLDIATLAAITPEEMEGAVLVLYEPRLAAAVLAAVPE